MPNLTTNSDHQQGFAHLLILVILTLAALTVVIPVNRHYNDGKSQVAGVFLAKGGDDEAVKVETKEVEKPEVKPRVELKTTPDRVRSEIRNDNLRVKFELKDGEVSMETKVKSAGEEVELKNGAEDQALKEVEKELEKDGVKVATAPGQIALVQKRVGALSRFPLSVNPTTHELTVTTPAGTKVVAVLPQAAVDNMLASKVMDNVVTEKNTNFGSVPSLVNLDTKNGVLGYEVKGKKNHKLFGLIPLSTDVTAFVSAENGQVVETDQSLLGRILDKIAL